MKAEGYMMRAGWSTWNDIYIIFIVS